MRKTIFVLFILTYTSSIIFGQDTISNGQFRSKQPKLTGQYVVLGPQRVTTFVTPRDTTVNTVWDTTTTLTAPTFYRVGNLINGNQTGIWESYWIGNDTLFWRGLFENDTLLESTDFYSNGNIKRYRRYFLDELVLDQYYLSNGIKYVEHIYLECKDVINDYDVTIIEYYENGILKFFGKLKVTNGIRIPYDKWYQYSDRGELYKMSYFNENGEPVTTTYKIKGKYYEWYDEGKIKTKKTKQK